MVSSTITDGIRQGGQGHEIPQGSCGANRARIRFAEDRNRRSCSAMSPIDLTSFLVFLYTSQVAVRKDCDGFKLVAVQQWLIMRWRFEVWDSARAWEAGASPYPPANWRPFGCEPNAWFERD